MSTKFRNLKNDLEDLEHEGQFEIDGSSSTSSGRSTSKLANYILLFAFIATLTFYAGSKLNFSGIQLNPIENFVQGLNQPSEDLLNQMGASMEEMGYGTFTHEELINLRNEGVTATFTSQVREAGFTNVTLEEMIELGNAGVSASYITEIQDAGYSEITLDQIIELENAGVSATFTRMMSELGYELTVQDLLDLEAGDVTAYFTSNMLDLGYTMEELTKENLIRMRNIGVTHQQAEQLINEKGERPTVDELIRNRISNQ
ncbi:MAG TPA: hypothetical protein VFM80_07685 [Gracilimonas sp.]|uniref:hypothetical protein n=1 Tax=Gracilimonas sp. TaxID=1974203 RepID=UPI002DA57C50|nr:hypothetical protein [Gracilimonas sp.]